MKIKVLVEVHEGWHNASAYDDVGLVAAVSKSDRKDAVELVKKKTIRILGDYGTPPELVEFDVQDMNPQG